MAQGLQERADLLEQVMADLYGPGRLVSDGLLPPNLVAENPEWLRPLVGHRPASGHFLHFLAFEIGRSPDGSWIVMGDRVQAPAGAGFALENRVATSKVFADHYATANVERLAGLLPRLSRRDAGRWRAGRDPDAGACDGHAFRTCLYRAVPRAAAAWRAKTSASRPRASWCAPWPGPEPVATLWRRLDGRFADPLELEESSAIGTPGLVAAIRAGQIGMINAIGSGILESRALLAFLPRIAQQTYWASP